MPTTSGRNLSRSTSPTLDWEFGERTCRRYLISLVTEIIIPPYNGIYPLPSYEVFSVIPDGGSYNLVQEGCRQLQSIRHTTHNLLVESRIEERGKNCGQSGENQAQSKQDKQEHIKQTYILPSESQDTKTAECPFSPLAGQAER